MKGLKLTLLGLGILLFGCAYVITENYILLFPGGELAACVIGLAVMVMGYRKDDEPNETDSERQEDNLC